MPVRYFVADGEKYHPGIPAADLEQSEYDALPKHLQETVDTSALYRKSKPRADADQPAAPAAKDDK
jgi:hypothetical protein